MTLSKFQKPAIAEEKMFETDRICGKEQKPFEAISEWSGVCKVYCVPEGPCEGRAQTGKLNYLGITGSGNCKGKGYTVSAELPNTTMMQQTVEWLKNLQGPCKGMTLSKFQKPAAETPDPVKGEDEAGDTPEKAPAEEPTAEKPAA